MRPARNKEQFGGNNRRFTWKARVVIVSLLASALGLAACSSSQEPLPTSTRSVAPPPAPQVESQEPSVETISKGAQLYATNCQSCHGDREGEGGSGLASAHNDTGHTWHHPDAQLKDWILNGKFPGAMPPFKDALTEEEVDAVLAYIKTWWAPDQLEGQADISRRYQEALDKQRQSQ